MQGLETDGLGYFKALKNTFNSSETFRKYMESILARQLSAKVVENNCIKN